MFLNTCSNVGCVSKSLNFSCHPSSQKYPCFHHRKEFVNHFTPKSNLIDFTLSNTRRFYSSKGDHLGVKGLKDHLSTITESLPPPGNYKSTGGGEGGGEGRMNISRNYSTQCQLHKSVICMSQKEELECHSTIPQIQWCPSVFSASWVCS